MSYRKPKNPRKAQPKSKLAKMQIKERKLKTLIKRRGRLCFYCGKTMHVLSMTKEHLLSKSLGGSNRGSNIFLAHGWCNNKAGNLPVSEKKRLRKFN